MNDRTESEIGSGLMKIKGTVAGEISCSKQFMLPLIPDHEGKIAYQMHRCCFPPLFISKQDQQAVRNGLPVYARDI
ncbi:hypothetical protein D3C86_2198890 [compost metagenome]